MGNLFSRQALEPFPLLLLLIAVGLARLWLKRRDTRGRLLGVTIPFLLLVLFSMPCVAYWLRGSLEWPYPALAQRPDDIQAIVVLGGGVFVPDGQRRQSELDADTQARCLLAADLYLQRRPCPIVVSGGKSPDDAGPAPAEVMRDLLVRLGVNSADILVEARSRSTFDNAVESCQLLRHKHLAKIVLVTDATHLRRAVGCFARQGMDVTPGGCQYRATPHDGSRLEIVPNPGALRDSQRFFHEWLGVTWYWLRGRI
jgi:uncharacterized SAM-binding protein YcdF (DUF218 family)